jgi:hypothetical protein
MLDQLILCHGEHCSSTAVAAAAAAAAIAAAVAVLVAAVAAAVLVAAAVAVLVAVTAAPLLVTGYTYYMNCWSSVYHNSCMGLWHCCCQWLTVSAMRTSYTNYHQQGIEDLNTSVPLIWRQ